MNHNRRRKSYRPLPEVLSDRLMLTSLVPAFSSFPGADHIVYLDFDGQKVEGSTWNATYETIHAPAFDMDGDTASFSPEELERIELFWGQMAEDFHPFNINVTTVDPSIETPGIFAESAKAQRVIFSSSYDSGPGGTGEQWMQNPPAGTAAFRSWFFEFDNPLWVFAKHRPGGSIASHEFGHALGLRHDGELLPNGGEITYRASHGTGETRWSPIMGLGTSVLSQWSQGEYENGSNREDDIALLRFNLGRRADDHQTISNVELVDSEEDEVSTFLVEGIIEERSDDDIFSFHVETESVVEVSATPWELEANLDIGISLWGHFPISDTTVNPVDSLSAGFERVLSPGTYYLTVRGTGKAATPTDQGYSDYGSLGYYQVAGSISPVSALPGDINLDGMADGKDIDALYALLGSSVDSATEHADLDENGSLTQTDVDILVRDILESDYGDFNVDGRVDFLDFLVLSTNFGQTNTDWSLGDADGDGKTEFTDFLQLSVAFGFDRDSDEGL